MLIAFPSSSARSLLEGWASRAGQHSAISAQATIATESPGMAVGPVDATRRTDQRWRKAGIILIAIVLGISIFLGVIIFANTWPPRSTFPCDCPLGSALALSSASEGTPYNHAGVTYYPYTFNIESTSSGITAKDLAFELQNSAGTDNQFVFVGLVDVSSCWVGSYSGGWTVGTPAAALPGGMACGVAGPNLTSHVSSGDQLLLVTTASVSSEGFQLLLTFQGVGMGTIAAAIP